MILILSVLVKLSCYGFIQQVLQMILSILSIVLPDWSLLSGAANGLIAVHDLQAVPTAADIIQRTYPAVCRTDADNTCRHRGSVETVQWYPVDTGMFVSSGNDTYVKVWDTNVLRVSSLYGSILLCVVLVDASWCSLMLVRRLNIILIVEILRYLKAICQSIRCASCCYLTQSFEHCDKSTCFQCFSSFPIRVKMADIKSIASYSCIALITK